MTWQNVALSRRVYPFPVHRGGGRGILFIDSNAFRVAACSAMRTGRG